MLARPKTPLQHLKHKSSIHVNVLETATSGSICAQLTDFRDTVALMLATFELS